MYVRLGFSVAIHVDPEILIVDEVLAVGDEQFQRKCFDHLADLRRRGVTIVVVPTAWAPSRRCATAPRGWTTASLQMVGAAGDVASEYLKRVNEREAEDRAADAAAAAEAAATAAGKAYVPDSETWFGEDIEIDRVFFTDADGEEVGTGVTGEPLALNIAYNAHKPVDSPVFGYTVPQRQRRGRHGQPLEGRRVRQRSGGGARCGALLDGPADDQPGQLLDHGGHHRQLRPAHLRPPLQASSLRGPSRAGTRRRRVPGPGGRVVRRSVGGSRCVTRIRA